LSKSPFYAICFIITYTQETEISAATTIPIPITVVKKKYNPSDEGEKTLSSEKKKVVNGKLEGGHDTTRASSTTDPKTPTSEEDLFPMEEKCQSLPPSYTPPWYILHLPPPTQSISY
jgi:hypothetical protein